MYKIKPTTKKVFNNKQNSKWKRNKQNVKVSGGNPERRYTSQRNLKHLTEEERWSEWNARW